MNMGVFSGLLDLLFPPKCAICHRVLRMGKSGICEDCVGTLAGQEASVKGTFFSRCVVSLRYEGNVRESVHRFKFGDQSGYATAFGKIMARTIASELSGQYDLITWIPVSPKRLKERGYDQSMLLALAAALELGDVAVETLKKPKNNEKQSEIADTKQRKENVKDAYEAVDPELIRGKRILLIDDVITTGSTMEEGARTLLRAGASSVVGAALAKPPKKHTKEESL